MSHEHWSTYWKTNVSGSFGEKPPAWYISTLEPFWSNHFSHQKPKSQLLDIATGNGAVAKIAQQISIRKNKKFSITATDKASHLHSDGSINPSPDNEYSKINFLPNTPAESLNFPANSFDLVTSQFGIEYSNTSKSLLALKKCIKPSAEILIIAHRKDSIIYKQSRNEVDQYRQVLQQQPFFKRLETLLKSMGEIKSTQDIEKIKVDPRAAKARESFNRLVARLLEKNPNAIVIAQILKSLKPLFEQHMMIPLHQKIYFINTLKQQQEQAQQRLLEMLSAAMDEKLLQKFLQKANSTGFEKIVAQPFIDIDGHLLAWEIRLKAKG